jgi:hypothetical protein
MVKSGGTQNQEWLCWRGPAGICSTQPKHSNLYTIQPRVLLKVSMIYILLKNSREEPWIKLVLKLKELNWNVLNNTVNTLIKTVVIDTSIQNAKMQTTHVKTVHTQVHSCYQILFLSYSPSNCLAELKKNHKILRQDSNQIPSK